jgi:membrane-associated phospholipid phosphatase
MRLRIYGCWSAGLTITFLVVYGGLNAWTARRAFRLPLYADWELAIPRVPEAVLIYVSIQLLFLLPLWLLNIARIHALGRAMLTAILVAGALFAVLPGELGFDRALPNSWLAPLYGIVFLLDGPHNLFPSLHVGLSGLVLLFLARDARVGCRGAYATWWLLLCASVVLTHQHHLLDVAGGVALALVCYRLSGDPALRRAAGPAP